MKMYVHVRTPHSWAHVVSKDSSFYFGLLSRSLMVSYTIHLKALEFMTTVLVNNKVLYFCTLQTMDLPLDFPSHFSFLLTFLKTRMTMTKMEPSKTNGNGTTILSQHPYIPCHFANYAAYQTLYVHICQLTPAKWMHNYVNALTTANSAYKTTHTCHVCHA